MRMKYFNHQIPESDSWNTVHAQTWIERTDFSFCRTRTTEVCFSHPTCWYKCLTSKMHTIPPDVHFESLGSPSKSESRNNPQDFVNFVSARASLFTDHKGLVYQCEPKVDISEQFVSQTVDNSPTDPFSSSLNWWSFMHGVATLKNLRFFIASDNILQVFVRCGVLRSARRTAALCPMWWRQTFPWDNSWRNLDGTMSWANAWALSN